VDDGAKACLHAGGLLSEIGNGTRYALADARGSVAPSIRASGTVALVL
jgi:hypothetical protein